MRQQKTNKLTTYWYVVLGMVSLILVLNLAACAKPFCNWYKAAVYPFLADLGGYLTGWYSVPLGELLMYFGSILLAIGLLSAAGLPFFHKKAGYRRYAKNYGKMILGITVGVLLIYTLNWVIPFRSDILKVKGARERSYTLEEVRNVRNHLVEELNLCALAVQRDEEGKVIYHNRVNEAVAQSMEALKEEYPILRGYYPPIKTAICSDFLEWMNIGGYTYPYTFEVTYNKYVTDLYYPVLLAHELSHHKGYYQENEANYISFLACINSEDSLVRYAGYLEYYLYISGAYVDTLYASMSREEAKKEILAQPSVLPIVWEDQWDALEISTERYEADSHPAEKLESAAGEVADVGWSVQADILQENCYDGVVKMILEYYDALEGGLDHAF